MGSEKKISALTVEILSLALYVVSNEPTPRQLKNNYSFSEDASVKFHFFNNSSEKKGKYIETSVEHFSVDSFSVARQK